MRATINRGRPTAHLVRTVGLAGTAGAAVIGTLIAIALLVTDVAFSSAAPAAPLAVHYVALGDSYSSGVGSGGMQPGPCLRSTLAYPQLWATEHHADAFVFAACAGAQTTDVLTSQLGALDPATSLVTITVGGNDINFAWIMKDCNVHRTDACVRDVTAAEQIIRTTLPGRLDAVYAAIRSRAPFARVIVLGYPEFYDRNAPWCCLGLSHTSRRTVDDGADLLDTVIQTEAIRFGYTFVDVRSRFAAGHEICDSGSWLHSVDWLDLAQSYHPTSAGQSGGYLAALDGA